MTDLVTLQNEITRDVSRKLRARLSGEDMQKLAKNYTANADAYQLYLKGRHHVLKLTRPEIERGIACFQQAIAIDQTLELDPNSAEEHHYYAHLLSNTGRHTEALAEIKRARELDPTNMRINALEGQFLLHAGRTDDALASLRKTFELEPNFWMTYQMSTSAYIEKGMFDEAIAEARKGREIYDWNSRVVSFLGYALAKSGRRAEARAELEALLKLSAERYIPPYNFAMIYNGLGERDKTLAWLERGVEQRDPRMVFLKVEPKWNNLRSDPRFQDLMRRVGFTP
jgi:Flp pilus assembly protein TadD